MSDASRRFTAILALVIGILAVAPAKALECRGGFGGVQGWGGLYRDNRDVGSFPIYIAYGDGVVVEQTFPRRHRQVYRQGPSQWPAPSRGRLSLRARLSACHCICQ